jgi:hypothetical protein
MKALKVNGDYEQVLFYAESGSASVNLTLECFVLFLEDRPLFTKKKYSQDYLAYVEEVSGNKPQFVSEDECENWWGRLEDQDLERFLNSKITSSEINLKYQWCPGLKIIWSVDDLDHFPGDVLFKNPYGMSGQKFKFFRRDSSFEEQKEWVTRSLAHGDLIREPHLHRVRDFSHYVYSNGEEIAYQNLIDAKGQYRGTLFQDYKRPMLESLSFFDQVDWTEFRKQFEIIKTEYKSSVDYSVDSFVYDEAGQWKVRSLCEVNARRTMGRVAYDLSQKYAGDSKWTYFFMTKPQGDFKVLKKKLHPLLENGLILLTPGDTRYEMFFLSAKDATEGREKLRLFNDLLPNTHTAIEI